MKNSREWIGAAAAAGLIVLAGACSSTPTKAHAGAGDGAGAAATASVDVKSKSATAASAATTTEQASVVHVLMATSAGDIVLELDPAAAPITVANFLSYMEPRGAGGYDGSTFHRVVPGFVIQGGGYTAEMRPLRSGAAIKNEWPNGLSNARGTIAMARDADPDTATREFFINLADNAKLDTPRDVSGKAGYAVFGRVIAGMDVVDRIAAVRTAPKPDPAVTDGSLNNVPVDPVVIRAVRRISPEEARRRAAAAGAGDNDGAARPAGSPARARGTEA